MTKYSFEECCTYTGITGLAAELNNFYTAFCEKEVNQPNPPSFLRIAFVAEILEKYQIPSHLKERVFEAIKEIEGNEILLLFTQFLVSDMCEARHRCDFDDYHAMEPQKAMKNADLYSMLLLIACIEPSIARLEKLGIPAEIYKNIPYTPLNEQMRKYKEGSDGRVTDFPWDMNFYTCSIFLFDRFYFIPYRLDDDIVVYRNTENDQTIAFFTENIPIRRDGQLDGVNGIYDGQSFANTFCEDKEVISGTPINPRGIVENTRINLDRGKWRLALKKGDLLLGTHIPGGEGYTPERLRTSTKMAKQFFDTYFPDMPIKGFGSESWLYDPHMNLFLKEDSNICRMQDQMYIYPILSGDGQMWGELYGSEDKPPQKLKTTLEKKVWEYMQKGGRMTPSSMFLLYGDMDGIGGQLYGDTQTKAQAMKQLT